MEGWPDWANAGASKMSELAAFCDWTSGNIFGARMRDQVMRGQKKSAKSDISDIHPRKPLITAVFFH